MGKKEKVMVILFFALAVVVIGGSLILYALRDRLPDEVWYVLGIIAFSVMGISGLFDFIKSIIMSKAQKSKDAVTVRGIIVDHVISKNNSGSGRTWIPIYEYYADGEIRRIKGKVSGGRMGKYAVGAEVEIVHNNVTGEAFCASDPKNIRWIGLVFMVMGFAIVAVLILKIMGRI